MSYWGRKSAASHKHGAAIMEYVILAVGIGVLVTFAVILFGRGANEQINNATKTLTGEQAANTKVETGVDASTADNDTEALGK